MLLRSTGCEPEAGDDLIEDEQRSVTMRDVLDGGEESRSRLLTPIGSMTTAATSSGCSAKMRSRELRSLYFHSCVSACVDAGTPALRGL